MNRTPLQSGGPLPRYTPLRRRAPLAQGSGLVRHAALLPGTARNSERVRPRSPRDTGPSRAVRRKVRKRSGGVCEFPGCFQPGTQIHHRYERGNGGAGPKSPAAPWINQPANLLHTCHDHNQWCSNGSPDEAEAMGWIIQSPTVPACRVSVLTSHSRDRVWLDNGGDWHSYEEEAA